MASFCVGIAFSASMPVSAASKAKVHAWFEFSSRFFATSILAFANGRRLAGPASIMHFRVKAAEVAARHPMRRSHRGVPKWPAKT